MSNRCARVFLCAMLVGCGGSSSGPEPTPTPVVSVPTSTRGPSATPTEGSPVAPEGTPVAWAGGAPFVRRSEDGGLTWSVNLNRAGGQVYGIDFTDPRTGWAVGGEINGPILLHTSDGGATWIDQASNGVAAPGVLRAVAFLNERHGVVAGGADFFESPLVFVTTDGGQRWDAAPIVGADMAPSAPSALASACLATSGVGVAAGEGVVLRTQDGGANWSSIAEQLRPPRQGAAVACPGERDLWVLAGAGPVAYSPDGGTTWVDRSAGVPRGLLFLDAAFVDPRTGWVAAFDDQAKRGVVLRTLDGGETWDEHTIIAGVQGLSGTFLSIAFVDSLHGVVAGFDSPGFNPTDTADLFSFVTEDAGTTWMAGFVPPETGVFGAGTIFDVDLVR